MRTVALVIALFASTASATEPQSPPRRVVALAPHITELLFAAGAGDRVVATVSSADHPEAAQDLPRVGDGVVLNPESLLAPRPDLLIAWHPTPALTALDTVLRNAGITIRYSAPQTLSDIADTLQDFGQLFRTSPVADPVAQTLRQRVQSLRDRYADRPRLNVFLDLGGFPVYTLGSDALFNELLSVCGGQNLYANHALSAFQSERETVLARRPDVLLVAAAPDIVERHRAYWARLGLPAASENKVLGIDPDLLLRPGPRMIDAAEQVCDFLEQQRLEDAATD